ncbi:TIP41-like protein isoform X2 [Portunus trituberculatus]|nr:TIP41-like protein isoform X2 [Portunus trituberculatus]
MPQPPTEAKTAPPDSQTFTFGDWTVAVTKSHIMGSQCEADSPCGPDTPSDLLCNYCRYERELSLPSLPDMVFADNTLQVQHREGGTITFTALDALRSVNTRESSVQVAHAAVWREARADCQGAQKVVEPFDWTYTTTFRGTLAGTLRTEPTEERIDLDKLKVREEIKFYSEVYLYDDELDDNGCTKCVAKVRVMPSGIFVVFRHYLRVDQVLVRINDTRLFSPAGANFFLRESSTRQAAIEDLKVPAPVYTNPDIVWQHLPLVEETVDKIICGDSNSASV